ncbi:Adenosylcobinamide-phosphate guanylyltransferase [Dehalogenimonas lykanthroporepellens BL-DC-9]|jgi:adenosylcobinamide kinase/adenosylcobinamide-phosphate guanylyltransferase|nr:Adenosylcobinamide-phosphate guanylyltransferase [Dehalogenimonas lykanthroporepellens BL-DC-9]
MNRKILLIGGARSGKSNYAEELAKECGGEVLFVATAEAGDEEMRKRIAAHQKSRPDDWRTLEAPTNVGKAIAEDINSKDTIIFDCVTLLVTNILCRHMSSASDCINEELFEAEVKKEIDGLIGLMEVNDTSYILVTNEVGEGIIPIGAATRAYRDALGRANQQLAKACSEVYLMVAGIPLKIK